MQLDQSFSPAGSPVKLTWRLAALIGMFAVGCGSESAEKVTPESERATVSGSVTNDGKPVTADSVIVFSCPDLNVTASGKLDSLGKFSLRPASANTGIPVGRYEVMIRGPEPAALMPGTQEYQDRMMGKTKAPEPPKDIPQNFTAFSTSGIALEIKPGQNTFDLDLAKLKK